MALAVQTGIPPSVWADEGEAAIVTALELLNEGHKGAKAPDSGPVMSG